jgi:hypothetical protein
MISGHDCYYQETHIEAGNFIKPYSQWQYFTAVCRHAYDLRQPLPAHLFHEQAGSVEKLHRANLSGGQGAR